MNILHHKSWHTRTRKNIEKVRKDEKKALEEQIEKARKVDIAEQERRIQELRNRFNVDQKSDKECSKLNNRSSNNQTNDQHINFFKPEYDNRVNKAHELEKKIEQEQWEKKVGILTYLGGNKRDDLPWYEKMPTQLDKEISYKDVSILQQNDPLNKIKQELNKRKQKEIDSNKNNKIKDKRLSKSKQQFNRKDNNQIDNREESLDQIIDKINLSDKELKLIKLREKRLKREAKESSKTKNLLNNNFFDLYDSCLNERDRAYSNQFNPHLSRK